MQPLHGVSGTLGVGDADTVIGQNCIWDEVPWLEVSGDTPMRGQSPHEERRGAYAVWTDPQSPIFRTSPGGKCLLAGHLAKGGGTRTFQNPSSVTASASNLYNPTAFGTDNLTPTGTYTTLEPLFLVYRDSAGIECVAGSSDTCLPSDLHLSVTSPLVNAGSSAISDLDGSRSDLGIHGGALGGSWDRDQDGAFDWFWPGEHSAAPSGFSPGAYDQDDANALIK